MKGIKLLLTRSNSNQRGYTLVEMIIVLFVLTAISSFSFGNMKATYDAGKRNEIIQQLHQDLFYAQQMAMSHNLSTTVIFLNGNKEYVIRQGGQVILRRPVEQYVTFVPVTLSLNDLSFLPDGNVRRSGTMQISINDHSYRIVVLLGRGRFYIEKL